MTAAAIPGDLVGAILNRRYPLERAIGSGGMGTVYASRNPDDGRPVAIKLLSVDYLHDAEVKSRFVEEGRMCHRLVHPNIVRVWDVQQAEDGTPYIVMELLEGVPLSSYTRSGVRVPAQQAMAILQGVLAGLGAAHGQGIVHRDLKPENVILSRDPNGTFAPKILDFGIAKVMDAAGGMGHRTRTGVLLGTPAYMSPEQIQSAKQVDARSDLWAAGVMFYEMLAGRVAFAAPTEYARLAAVLSATPPPIESVDPQLARFSGFLQHAMQKERTQRFQSALEMARALATLAGAEAAIAASPPLTRLPDVPSFWAPSPSAALPPPTAPVGLAPGLQSLGQPAPPATAPAAAAPTAAAAPGAAAPNAAALGADARGAAGLLAPIQGPSGTLASREGLRVTDPPPRIAVVAATSSTVPSEGLPMLTPPGMRRGLVVALVLAALAAGFLLGFATAKLL